MIDFSNLDALVAQESPANDTGVYKPAQTEQAQNRGISDDLRKLQRQADETTAELERARATYREYQANIIKAQTLPSEILKAMLKGESCEAILLKAAKCISSMTGDGVFYQQVEKRLVEIYGYALGQAEPLEMELEKVRARIDKLTAAVEEQQGTAAESGIKWALKLHQGEAAKLETAIKKAHKE